MKICSVCKQEKPKSEFNVRKASKDGLNSGCRDCKRAADSANYQKYRSERIQKVSKRTQENLAAVTQIKVRSGCQICGLKDERAWLFDFDHLGDKKELVSRLVSHKMEVVLEEARKCQVLCSNCHRTLTYERAHGTLEPIPPKKATQIAVLMRNWEALLRFKSRPCMDCGKSFHFTAMDCDHRDPKTKVGEPSNMARNNSEASLLAELSKCDVVCSGCHRIRERERLQPTKTPSIRELAQQKMKQIPGISYQKAIRDVIAQIEGPKANAPTTMRGGYVTEISTPLAASIILKYEWLGTMGHPQACYGLWFDIEEVPMLAGVVCFGLATGIQASHVCGSELASVAICLERGACVHWAPKNAGSFLVAEACRQASKDHGWKIFYAYSDPAANEIGTIYQACNWIYLGQGPGHGPTRTKWVRPDGRVVTSRTLRARGLKTKEALALGWKKETVPSRGKYVWFQGTPRERKRLRGLLVHPPQNYPKRPAPFSTEL